MATKKITFDPSAGVPVASNLTIYTGADFKAIFSIVDTSNTAFNLYSDSADWTASSQVQKGAGVAATTTPAGTFVTGIDTDVGKTVVSAVLMKALESYYWKPIQCGLLPKTDRQSVADLTRSSREFFVEEKYLLKTPCSPHIAANIERKYISLDDFILPSVDANLVVEGAGGCMVPLNNKHTLVDLIKKLDLSTVVISKNYLGSINHTLMTIKVLQAANIKIGGLVFNGLENSEIESFISEKTNIPILFRLGELKYINHEVVSSEALRVREEISRWI